MRQPSPVTIRVAKSGTAQTQILAEPASTLTSHAPPIASPSSYRLCFDGFVLAPAERRLTRGQQPVEIGGRSFDLLLALVEQPGRVIPKRELVRRVWPGVTVEDVALRFHMTKLRKALGDGHDGRRLITTQVGVGYGFVGVVKRLEVLASSQLAQPPEAPLETRLPSKLDRLIGRDADLRSLVERVDGGGLLTIVGPGGVGKTSLVIEAAHALASRFADRTTFVDLATTPTSDMLIPAVATALGLPAAANSPTSLVLDHLRERRQLLILDTGEHLTEAVASLCEQITATASEVRIIATSRQAFRARNEQVHRLAPHDPSAAGELFMHHFRAAGGAPDVAAHEARTIAEICQRLDRLALAIELTALRAATHGIEATARILGDPLSLSWSGRRTAALRQRTLTASLDWSTASLSDAECEVFKRLSILDEPFSLEALLAEAPTDALDRSEVSTALDELTDKSLIVADAGLYRCPEVTRLYARERWCSAYPADGDTAPSPARR